MIRHPPLPSIPPLPASREGQDATARARLANRVGLPSDAIAELPLQPGTVVRLARVARGQDLLGVEDAYTDLLSPFDLAAKLARPGRPGSVGDYLTHARRQVRAWTAAEVAAMTHAVEAVAESIARLELRLPLPPVVEVVRTTLAEEGFMVGYTRRQVIVLAAAGLTARTFAHELFHVLSRHAPAVRDACYRLLGFRTVPPIAPPPDLAPHLITNPDAPAIDTVARLNLEGEWLWAGAFLQAHRDYAGGPLNAYVAPRLLVAEEGPDGLRPRLHDGRAIVLLPEAVDGLAHRLGGNTPYDIHPEEVSAEHFVFMLARRAHLPRPDLVARMWEILRHHTLTHPPADHHPVSPDPSHPDATHAHAIRRGALPWPT